ncbi:MAG: dihydropyrimidinase [Nitratireductor sp.]|nr:dihydropyrimidinase [Nitratireductor sp.]
MKPYDLIIRNGLVASASEMGHWDIAVKDGKVAALGTALPDAAIEIDATGKIVLPGGVDAHCHLDEPTGGPARMADDFRSGTLSAAFGGTTTVIPFARQMKGAGLAEAVEDYHRRADGKAYIDYAFHMIITDPSKAVLGEELPRLIDAGYSSFKIYMTYDDLKLNDRQILEVLDTARQEQALVMVHAENADCIDFLTERLEARGLTGPKFHAAARPPLVEREAVHRAVAYSELVGQPILIVHVSGAEASAQIAGFKARGLPVFAETCPQYLFLTKDDLDLRHFDGAKHICSPPPRTSADQQEIWNGLRNGLFSVFSSDHAPFSFDSAEGKKVAGENAPFRKVPNGIPGLETRLPLLFSEGVGKNRIDLCRFVKLTSTNPAKIYGLFPRKGALAVGSDADITIWDPDRQVTIRNDLLHHNVDYTPYEGRTVTGWPETVISRGEIVIVKSQIAAEAGRGHFLPCARFEHWKDLRA